MRLNDCYACRNYFTDCEDGCHPRRVRAKHKDGSFWWGRAAKRARGAWVKICVWCRDALSQG